MKAATIKKYQEALQDFVDFIKKSNGYVNGNEINYLRKKHQVSATLWTDAVKLDIINKTGKSRWKVIVDKIEPIHIRRLLQYRYDYYNDLQKKRRNQIPIKFKSIKSKAITNLTKNEKTINILWGLFKIKY